MENDVKVKVKKPFYKRVWFIVICVIVLIGIALAIIGSFGPKISDDFALGKTGEIYGLQYKIPSGWKEDTKNSTKDINIYAKYSDDKWLGGYIVSARGRAEGADEDTVKSEIEGLHSAFKDVDVSDIEKADVSGADSSYTADCTYTNDGKDYESYNEYVIADNTVFIFTVISEPSAMDKEILGKLVKASNISEYKNPAVLKSISAKYSGSTKKDVKIDSDSDIIVKAKYSDGMECSVSGWKITNPGTLEAGKSSSFTISYEGKTTVLKIACTSMTAGQKNAYNSAKNYLDLKGFSRSGLIRQLSSEYGNGYSESDAVFAVNMLEQKGEVNWNKEAKEAAKSYLDLMSMSKSQLIGQLESSYGDGFTHSQAVYGANAAYGD